jgi:anti-anti-sigma regulatory factor
MFQIRRSARKGVTVLALSGRIEGERVPELEALLEAESGAESGATVLDLTDVRLVSREAVRFLAACEASGVELRNCSPYVREWIDKGKVANHEP